MAGAGTIEQKDIRPDVLTSRATNRVVQAAGTIGAKGDIVLVAAATAGDIPTCVVASSATQAGCMGILCIAMHAAVSGDQVELTERLVLRNVDTSLGVAGDPVYLSTAGDWSLSAGTIVLRIGTVLRSSTTGSIELHPKAFAAASGANAVFTGTLDLNGNLDLDNALVAAGDGANVAMTINHATAVASGVDVDIAQLTTARTAGYVAGVRSKTTSLAGDTGNVVYAAFYALAPTDGGGTVTHVGLYDAGNDYAVWAVDNVATGWGTGATGTPDISVVWNGTNLVVSQLTANSNILWGASGAGINHTFYGDTAGYDAQWDQTNNQMLFKDNAKLTLGTGSDAPFSWDGAKVIGGSGMWADCPSPMDSNFDTVAHMFFRDFSSDGDEVQATGWVVTADSTGTAAYQDVVGGTLHLLNAATTDNDATQAIWAQETFKLATGKKLWMEIRLRCSAGDATNLDFFAGLLEAEDLTGVADNMPANGIGFHKEDGDTNIDASSSDGGTDLQQAAVGTLVDATYITLGLVFDGAATGNATLTPWVNGVAGTAITSVTYATMAEMAAGFMIRNGDATTRQSLTVDYIKVVQLR